MKTNILTIGCSHFAFDKIDSALKIIKLLNSGILCEWEYPKVGPSFYTPKDHGSSLDEVRLEANQVFKPKLPPKPEKKKAVLGLPSPRRGSIMCICEHSYVAPKETCPHCGRSFAESHNRTHDTTAIQSDLHLL
jgi:hypothetical protein